VGSPPAIVFIVKAVDTFDLRVLVSTFDYHIIDTGAECGKVSERLVSKRVRFSE
jgi:hypothetical protein